MRRVTTDSTSGAMSSLKSDHTHHTTWPLDLFRRLTLPRRRLHTAVSHRRHRRRKRMVRTEQMGFIDMDANTDGLTPLPRLDALRPMKRSPDARSRR